LQYINPIEVLQGRYKGWTATPSSRLRVGVTAYVSTDSRSPKQQIERQLNKTSVKSTYQRWCDSDHAFSYHSNNNTYV